jgi:hypothetical protein
LLLPPTNSRHAGCRDNDELGDKELLMSVVVAAVAEELLVALGSSWIPMPPTGSPHHRSRRMGRERRR